MLTTDSAKYAVRAVANMAGREDLVRAQVLKPTRGRGGGFILAEPPDTTKVITVLNAVEDMSRIEPDCVLDLSACNDEAPCPAHDAWKPMRQALVATLKSMTVADLASEIARKKALQK
jgi:Rrf2 family iron-sulfur cluster assembly transcriptional regulator